MTAHVPILCTHNSARSVLAEGMLGHDVKAHSAGSAPGGRINPLAIETLNLAAIDSAGDRNWGYPDPSNAEGGDAGTRRAVPCKRPRQA
jgi:arsenate reductase